MSYWNHRVIKHTKTSVIDKVKETETWFSIHEVFYDDAGHPNGYTEDAVEPFGESLLELADELNRFQSALSKPVLVHEDFFPKTGSLHPRDIEPEAIEDVRLVSQDVENAAWMALESATVVPDKEDAQEPIPSLGFVIKQPDASVEEAPAIMCGSPVFKSFSKPVDQHEVLAQDEPGITKPCPFCQGRVLPREEWSTGTWCCDAQYQLRLDQTDTR